MRHGDKVKKLGRTTQHRRALLRNLVTALLRYERIRTTLPKAKEAGRLAERLIRMALTNTLAARRQAGRFIQDRTILKKLFDEVGTRFAGRPGGFTRVLKLGPREGDAAEMALLELLVREERTREKKGKEEKGGKKARPDNKPGDKEREREGADK